MESDQQIMERYICFFVCVCKVHLSEVLIVEFTIFMIFQIHFWVNLLMLCYQIEDHSNELADAECMYNNHIRVFFGAV